jgi:class 3 adenylate cyclase
VASAPALDLSPLSTPMNCPWCGFVNSAAARFCGGCGRAFKVIAGASPEAERRHVCVLFCDLVGSTPLSHRLDAEDFREVVGSYQRSCEAVVLRHGGFVAQYRGDSIEVYFGYPHAHEDDASRVVRCALEMLEAIRQLANATKLDLQVRIGVDSGRVVVGTLGSSGRSERVAVGETPNIAARAQAEAAPGEVVVTGSLWRLLPGTITVEPMGARKLKGVERPVDLFKVVGTRLPILGNREGVECGLSQWCCESCAGADADVAPTGSTANSTSTGPAFANISVASNGLPCWIGPLRFMIIRWNELGLSSTVCPGLISSPPATGLIRITPLSMVISWTSTFPATAVDAPVSRSGSVPVFLMVM